MVLPDVQRTICITLNGNFAPTPNIAGGLARYSKH